MLFMLLYVIDTALSFIFIHIIGNIVPSFLMVFVSVTLAMLFFNLINYKTIVNEYKTLLANNLNLLFLLNFFAFTTWIGSFLIPVYFSPSVCIMVIFFTTAICGNFNSYLLDKSNKSYLFIIGLILVNFIYLLILYASDIRSILIMLIFSLSSILTGVFGYFYLRTSFKITKAVKLTSTYSGRLCQHNFL